MTRYLVSVTVSETGSVVTETYVNQSTYEVKQAANNYGSPYLGSFDTSDEWRSALADYLTESIGTMWSVGGCHGWALVYTDEANAIYVFAVDFDAPNPQQ